MNKLTKKYIYYTITFIITFCFAIYPNSQGQYDIWNLINAISAGTWIMTIFYTKLIDDKNENIEILKRQSDIYERELARRTGLISTPEPIYDADGRVLLNDSSRFRDINRRGGEFVVLRPATEEPTNEEMIEYFDNEIENYNKIQLEQPKINKIDSEIII